MQVKEEIRLVEELDKKLLDVLRSKAHDYAGLDVLSNFKRLSGAAKELGIDVSTPLGYALFMVLLKIDRINNLVSGGKKPNNEGLEDSFIDGIGYLKLAYCLYKEE